MQEFDTRHTMLRLKFVLNLNFVKLEMQLWIPKDDEIKSKIAKNKTLDWENILRKNIKNLELDMLKANGVRDLRW